MTSKPEQAYREAWQAYREAEAIAWKTYLEAAAAAERKRDDAIALLRGRVKGSPSGLIHR